MSLLHFVDKWNLALTTLNDVISLKRIPKSKWNQCYLDIRYISQKFSDDILDHFYDYTRVFLERHVTKLLTTIQTEDTSNILQNYLTNWQIYSGSIESLDKIYEHFNDNYIRNLKRKAKEGKRAPERISSGPLEIGNLALYTWKHKMIIPLKDSMLKLLLDEFDKLQQNVSMNASSCVITGVINSFIEVENYRLQRLEDPLEFYETYFEQPILEQSSEYFKREAARLLQESTVSNYIVKARKFWENVGIVSQKYLRITTYYKYHKLCGQHMVGDHIEFLCGESKSMIKEERRDDMRNMYLVLQAVENGMNQMADIFQEHIQLRGISKIKSLKQKQINVHFVKEVLAVHHKYKYMVNEVFENDPCFSAGFDKALTTIVNYRFLKDQPSKSPEYLSKYFDNVFKKCKCEVELYHKLLPSITVLKYIDDKDVFQKHYQRYLAERLIYKQSQFMNMEEKIINKLKKDYGLEFTKHFYNMFSDIKLSEKLNTEFHNKFLKNEDQLNFTFSMNVLKTGSWPLESTTVTPFIIPNQLVPCIQLFEEFYKEQFKGRKLTWLYHLSQGELKLNYLKKDYLVIMHTFQMAILLLFQEHDTLKYSEMSDLLQLNTEQYQEHIDILVESKLLLIDGDNVSLNKSYTNKRTKVRLTATLKKRTAQEIKQTVSFVEDERKPYLQATIVRIMKARKLLRHNELVKEVFSLSKTFVPTIELIKKNINILIDKGYLERTPNVSNSYSYVA